MNVCQRMVYMSVATSQIVSGQEIFIKESHAVD